MKYQLLTICKAKGRTVWREKEDLLLKKIFGYRVRYVGISNWESGMKLPNSFTKSQVGSFLKRRNSVGSDGKTI